MPSLFALAFSGPSPTTTTYSLYESACTISVSTFLRQGCLGATLQSWSSGTYSLNATAPPGLKSGGKWAIAAESDANLYLHGSLVFLAGDMLNLSLMVHNSGAAGAQLKLELCGGDASTKVGDDVLTDKLPSGEWTQLTLPFSRFGSLAATQQINCLKISTAGSLVEASAPTASAATTPPSHYVATDETIYITEMQVSGVVRSTDSATAVPDATPTKAIVSPLLFGANFAKDGTAYAANRWGGNAVTRYAWDLDVQNHARDWYFEGIPNDADESRLPSGSSSDKFVAATLAAGATPVLTIPTIGWSPKDRQHRCGFSVARYGKQNKTDPHMACPDCCGNGDTVGDTGGTAITGNDPTDTDRPVGPDYAVAWLDHLVAEHGAAVINRSIFLLDNEPNYWSGTHRDVHPQPFSYDELWNYTRAYASAIKARHAGVRLGGPDTSSYQALTMPATPRLGGGGIGGNDGKDGKGGDDGKDGNDGEDGNGGKSGNGAATLTLAEALVRDVAAHFAATGVKLLDVLDVHCCPEAQWDATRLTAEADVALRMRLTRELWDGGHYAESWDARPMRYLAWLNDVVAAHAPWLRLACSEWNYSAGFADDDVAGAVVSLDALGVYAQQGVVLANKWEGPAKGTVLEYALFRFLQDYDGRGGSVAGAAYVNVTTDSALLGAHAFSSAAAFQLLLISKQAVGSMTVAAHLPRQCAPPQLYRLDKDHTKPAAAEPLPLLVAEDGGKTTSVTLPPVAAALVVCSHVR